MILLENEEEKRLWDIIEPYFEHHNEPPIKKYAPKEIFEAVEQYRALTGKNRAEAQAFFLGFDVDQIR